MVTTVKNKLRRECGANYMRRVRRLAVTAAVPMLAAAQPVAAQPQSICGIEFESPAQVQEQVELKKGLAGNTSDPKFVTYYDGDQNMSWAFTTPENPAHPAVVCRRMEKKDGKFNIAMELRCNATRPVCDELHQSFVLLNRMTVKKLNAEQSQ